MGFLLAAASAAILWIDLGTPLGVADGILYVVVVLLSLRSGRASSVTVWTLGATVLILAGWRFSPPGGEAWKTATNRLLSVSTVWAVAAIGVAHRKTDERARLAKAELARSEALAAVGRVAAIVAHRVRNPLSSVLTAARSLAGEGLSAQESAALREVLERQSRSLDLHLEDFLRLARSGGALSDADLDQDLEAALARLRSRPAE